MEKTDKFLGEHKLRAGDIEMEFLVELFLSEMTKGLKGEQSSLRMIPTYIEADNEFLKDTPVIAIDAGGTNFRSALISFKSGGTLEVEGLENKLMPGLDREVSKTEFFRTMAGYIEPLAGRSDRIGFCFSYPTEIFPDKDGRLIQFCKEVQAHEVVGQVIGKSLLDALGMKEKKIVLLNDTVATLLAGKSKSFGKTYDSYMGFILGTGTNTCYIEANRNILKKPELDQAGNQIVNVESGNFGKAPRTGLDILFDNTTNNPGNYTFEKMFSGGYFGGLCLTILKAAAAEGVLSAEAGERLNDIGDLATGEANNFVANPGSADNILSDRLTYAQDRAAAARIIDTLVDRAAVLVASNLSAVVLKTGKGNQP